MEYFVYHYSSNDLTKIRLQYFFAKYNFEIPKNIYNQGQGVKVEVIISYFLL